MEWQTDENLNNGDHIIIVKATGPEGVTTQASYTLTVTINCSKQIIVPKATVDQVYKVRDPIIDYTIPWFANDESGFC